VRARALAVLALTALAACRSGPPPSELAPAPELQPALVALDAWRARGRVAVRTPSDGFSASFDWREANGRGELDVRGPLGAGAARITQTADLIRIETGAAAPVEVPAPFDTLESELTTRLGFPLPIASLRYWLLGVPAPDISSEPVAGGFSQAGWTVAPAGFSRVPLAPAPLPSRLVLTRAGTQIKVAISAWQLGAP
jgi:outer membrane lipoprotein LolB